MRTCIATDAHTHVCTVRCGPIAQLVISKQVAELSPPFAWLGGGEVLLKLRVPVAELLRTGATVVECTKPRIRDGDEWV